MNSKKVLVAYFSRADENYNVGYIEKGNTQIVAEVIAEKTGGTLFHIAPSEPYPSDYMECIALAKKEMNANARPAIIGDIEVADYAVVFLGYPNWWGEAPMPVYTFIEQHDWHGKIVVPFCTHEGSGLGCTESRLRRACYGATFLPGLAIQGSVTQTDEEEVEKSVKHWLNKIRK